MRYMFSKGLMKGIMKRSYLEKLYFKKMTTEPFKKYNKDKNFCSRLHINESSCIVDSTSTIIGPVYKSVNTY